MVGRRSWNQWLLALLTVALLTHTVTAQWNYVREGEGEGDKKNETECECEEDKEEKEEPKGSKFSLETAYLLVATALGTPTSPLLTQHAHAPQSLTLS